MPLTNDDGGGGGGGTTGGVCTPSPSDQLAITNNLISRISDIEKFLSRLIGADVNANNLSELATNIGNILNGTIMLTGDGYSPYGPGGSIPVPAGFTGTVLSGNVITTWTDGVVSFEVIPSTGAVTGAVGVDTYLGGDTINYTTSGLHPLKGFVIEKDGGLVNINASTGEISFNSSTGVYLIGYAGLYFSYPAGAGVDKTVNHGFGDGVSVTYGNLSTYESVSGANTYFLSANYLFDRGGFAAPSSMFLHVSDSGVTGNTRSAQNTSLYVIKIK